MSTYLRLARLYFVLLAIVTVGRWLQGVFGTPYVKGHHIFSIVTLTLMASIFYGAFTRRWLGYRVSQAMLLGCLMGLVSQVVILLATLLSYALGMETFFNHSTALNLTLLGEAPKLPVPIGEALLRRAGGLVFNPLSSGVAGALGWALGGLLPTDTTK